MRRSRWPLLLFAALGLGMLLSLGFWQVQRLAEKEALIAAIDQRLSAPPQPLSLGLYAAPEDGVLAKVSAKGVFQPPILRKIASLEGGPAWQILQGLQLADGQVLLVSRGILREGGAEQTPSGSLEVEGLLMRHVGGQGLFDPENEVDRGRWYWWDVPAMYGVIAPERAWPDMVVLHLLPGSQGTEGLSVPQPKANLRNNHLGYAITWFGLAAVLLVITGLLVARPKAN